MGTFGWSEKAVGLSLAFVGLLVGIVQGGLIRITIPRFGQKNHCIMVWLFIQLD